MSMNWTYFASLAPSGSSARRPCAARANTSTRSMSGGRRMFGRFAKATGLSLSRHSAAFIAASRHETWSNVR